MVLATLLGTFSLALLSYGQPETLENHISSDLLAISGASQVFFPTASEYLFDIEHATPSSTEASACSVEPGSAEDVSEIVEDMHRTLDFVHNRRTYFDVTLQRDECQLMSGTVEIGPGLIWDQVYTTLGPTGVNVVGGRVPGVGVAGLTLGGGYSFLTSQYGLAVDNVAGYELVLPNGTIKDVTQRTGIVTKFILKSHPQGEAAWGGFLIYAENQLDAIKTALVNFQQENDTKAEVLVGLTYSSGRFSISVAYFYDAPTPSRVFDEFLDIPVTSGNVSTRSFADVFQSWYPYDAINGRSCFFGGAPVTQYSPAVFDAFVNQVEIWGPHLFSLDKNVTVTVVLEPFDKGLFSHGSNSAYPPDRSHAIFPTVLVVAWSNSSLDETMANALRNISNTIRAVALADGQNVSHAAIYPNYALLAHLWRTCMAGMWRGFVRLERRLIQKT
ncbi:hypothetical protein BJV77DRAFT_1124207 [Russula vinacea]|nr:hypothetical protein BJV77DRAFT_1124207 [Russula vinacea]